MRLTSECIITFATFSKLNIPKLNYFRYFLEDAIEMLDFVPPPPRKKGRGSGKKNPLAGDDYCADSDDEDCKQKEVDENLNLCVDTLV